MKILFVYPVYKRENKLLSPYLLNDLKIIRENHSVRECEFISLQEKHFFQILKDIILLFCGVFWSNLTFCWFGRLHAFFAVLFSKILRKKVIVVAGGDEAANITMDGKPFGLSAHPVKKWFIRFVLRFANKIIAVSKYNMKEILENTQLPRSKVCLIYHGLDSEIFRKVAGVEKERTVITVGNIDSENYIRKGLKLFVESAAFLPETPFIIVGSKFGSKEDDTVERLKEIAGRNVTLTGRIPRKDLVRLLSRTTVYIQASQHEAFGVSVAEAMLCECVPVVSRRTALPEVVGEYGFYLNELSAKELAGKIKEALQHPEYGKLARQRIIENFSLKKRRDKLQNLIESIAR